MPRVRFTKAYDWSVPPTDLIGKGHVDLAFPEGWEGMVKQQTADDAVAAGAAHVVAGGETEAVPAAEEGVKSGRRRG